MCSMNSISLIPVILTADPQLTNDRRQTRWANGVFVAQILNEKKEKNGILATVTV